MPSRFATRAPWRVMLSSVTFLTVAGAGLHAQTPSPQYLTGSANSPSAMFAPGSQYPAATPFAMSNGATSPGGDAASGGGTGAVGGEAGASDFAAGANEASAFQPRFLGEAIGAGDQPFAIADNPGYIDSAVIRNRFRLRYDSAYGDNAPDRAEFFYPKCGCFGTPDATGPKNPNGEKSVNYQEVSAYFEFAASKRFSAFIDAPTRFLNPVLNPNTAGFSDLQTGFKYAFVAEKDRFITFQFKTYIPTGIGQRGLGTNHVSLEPGLLIFRQLSDRLFFNGEIRDWIPVGGSDFAGNVIRYGMGLTYNVIQTDTYRLAPVSEWVGWTVLGGKEFAFGAAAPRSAAGDTIVNMKIGLRYALGDYRQTGGSALNDRHSFYLGYAHALTDNVWYRDMVRLDYTFYF